MTEAEWRLQRDTLCPSTLNHGKIATKHGNQMTQLGSGVTIFNLWCKSAAKSCYDEMVLTHGATHEHVLEGNQITVRRINQIKT